MAALDITKKLHVYHILCRLNISFSNIFNRCCALQDNLRDGSAIFSSSIYVLALCKSQRESGSRPEILHNGRDVHGQTPA